jgi:carboxymethylenebutenolidase
MSDSTETHSNPVPDAIPTFELTSTDGTRFTAHATHAAEPIGAGVVVLPGGRGLLRTHADLADRFAAAGINAVAIDHFGRTADLGVRPDDFMFAEHLQKTRPEYTAADVAAALKYLRSIEGGAARAAFTIGFSFGGAASLLQSAAGHGLAGVIGFYGWPSGSKDFSHWPAPVDLVKEFTCPVLAFFGGLDKDIHTTDVQGFEDALNKVGIEHEFITYPNAPHAFFDRRRAEFPEAAESAWERILAFITMLTPPRPRRGDEKNFTGTVWMDDLLAGHPYPGVHRVFFAPGARTHLHQHPAGQVLYVISGQGWTGNTESQEKRIGPGKLVRAVKKKRHWHGADPKSAMVHIAIGLGGQKAVWADEEEGNL